MAARTICKQGSDLAGEPMADYAPLRLHVPEPAVRPGDTPDFSNVRSRDAGSVARPPVDADPESIRDLAFSIIRVLNRDGEAVGPWAGLLDRRRIARRLAQHDDAARLRRAHADGAASGQDLLLHAAHGRRGRELRLPKALLPGDMNFPTYRQAGLLIAAGYPLTDMMCQIFSNERDPLRGGRCRFSIRRGSTASSRFREISPRNISRPSAGRWLRRSRTIRGSRPAGSATAPRRNPTSMPRWCSRPPTRRRWCSIS